MTRERLYGYLKLSIAHHPVCWQYRNHTFTLFNLKFCLGCSGFYSGLFIGFLLIFAPIYDMFNWEELVLISFFLYLPTMLRLIKIPFFKTDNKYFRFLFRFLLGFGVFTGVLSILRIQDLVIQIIQIALGIGLYGGITLSRMKDAYSECETCSFTRSNSCPGFSPFKLRGHDQVILVDDYYLNKKAINLDS